MLCDRRREIMNSRLTGSSSLLVAFIVSLVMSAPVAAAPVDYVIFNTGSLSELGAFTIDPTLALPLGESDVDMTALTFTETVAPFGALTVTLPDLSVGSFRARFLDGVLASITGQGSGTLAGGIDFFLDFTPFIPADPSLIDLNAVGTYALDAGMGAIIGESAIGSLGIKAAATSVPEPATALLFGIAAAATAAGTRRSTARRRLGALTSDP
jgi:hypothetical protein